MSEQPRDAGAPIESGVPATPEPTPAPADTLPSPSTDLTDGEWHRLHPASPLLKGGIALIAILGIVIVNLRDRLIAVVIPDYSEYAAGDPIDMIVEFDLVIPVLAGVVVVLALLVAGFWLSWRMHTFRVTDEIVEVRSGIVFRTNRKARLDRIQGINIQRPMIARLFGAAKLEVNQAGADANVQLMYLRGTQADDLRRDILALASGAQRVGPTVHDQHPSVVEQRVQELLGPELDPNEAPPESVVHLSVGRLAGSLALSETTIILVLVIIGTIVAAVLSGEWFALLGALPVVIGVGGYQINRFLKSLRYTIASTPDGVRVGFGLLSTTNSTVPPGRIHSVQVTQSLLWRPVGWWTVKVNRASQSSVQGAAGEQNTTILPVGSREDVERVLGLLLPGVEDVALIVEALVSRGGDDEFVNSPKRGRVLRWFSWRRNGYRILDEAVLLRHGQIWRDIVVVPKPRIQSVAVHQGPITRMLRLASLHVHTVAGPITANLGAIDEAHALVAFESLAAAAVEGGNRDRSHRWRTGDA